MRTMLIPLLTALLALGALAAGGAVAGEAAEIQHCVVSLISEAEVPAEEAGVLVEVKVREGQQVAEGDLLAQIDDKLVTMQHTVYQRKYEVATEQANNTVDEEYGRKAAEFARASYYRQVEANQKSPGAVAAQQIEEYRLGWEKAVLQIKQALVNRKIAGLEAQVSAAEVDGAVENLDRRKIQAPLDGVVVEVRRHAGEWVQPGDVVLHLVGMDRLRIEGFLSAADYMPSQIAGRRVTVTVELAGGRQATFEGLVVFVNPLVDPIRGEFLVWAEVDNRKEDGFWLLRPGLNCTMTIHLK